ncbi:MAG TPA: PQQ-binding-like beta-propeller repeat protein [Gemmataceae bacterium]|nr:PQQ-binding-like beta-propeller repeat protein [Gemmataceae bacterium]
MRYRLVVLLLLPLALGADWRQFRGTDSTGHADGGAPSELGADKNVAWKAALPGRGLSSPIVVGGRVFLTASGGPKQDRLQVLALDAKSGKQLWQRTFWATGPTDSHPKTSMAAPTPVSDGKRVVALFATGDIAALNPDGDVLWLRNLYEENPGATDGRGLASSPLLVAGTVVVHVETQNTSFAAGIDPETGRNRWRVERPREPNWTSPIAVPGADGKPLVLLQGASRLSALDPATGKEVWSLSRPSDPIASSVLSGKVLYVPGEKGLAALELQGNAAPKLLWEQPKLSPATASPVVLSGRVYSLRQGGILVAGDLKTGEVVGQLRLKGPFSASLVTAGGLLYCVNESGQAQVVRPDDKDGQVVARGDLGETVLGTPAIADGALYLRGEKHLWKIARP